MENYSLSGHNDNSFNLIIPGAVSLKGRSHLYVVTGSAEGSLSLRPIDSGRTGSFHSRRSSPHSLFATSSGGIHRRVKNPARGSEDDIDPQGLKKSLYLSGNSQALKRPGLLPGDIGILCMLGRASSPERFPGLSHLPEPANKLPGDSNLGFSFFSGVL